MVISFEEKYHFQSLSVSRDPESGEAPEHRTCHLRAPHRGLCRLHTGTRFLVSSLQLLPGDRPLAVKVLNILLFLGRSLVQSL